jgi:calcium-dependent protein kinase
LKSSENFLENAENFRDKPENLTTLIITSKMGCCKSSVTLDPKKFFSSEVFQKEGNTNEEPNYLKKRKKSIKITIREKVSIKLGHLYQYYDIGDVIGEGGFGCVRRGVQISTGQEVAIKTIMKSLVQRTDDTNAIMEVEILRTLDHPNILKIKEVVEDNRNYHIITELCTGGELFAKISAMKSFDEVVVSKYMNQIFSALAFCHEHGILHRDIKPENLLLQTDAVDSPIKIIDFGVSGLNYGQNNGNVRQFVSIFYRCPEYFSGICDTKSDVWSVGVIIYLMLAGYLPFKGKNEKQMAESIKNQEVLFEGDEWKEITEDCKDLLRHLLVKDPNERYSAKQAFQHPWISNGSNMTFLLSRSLSQLGVKNLLKFRFHMKLRHAVLEFIVSHFTHTSEIYELQQAFIAMDYNGDGKLTTEELTVACLMLEYTKEDVQDILGECDANMNGSLDYTEFLTAASNWKKVLNKNKLKATFDCFDIDKDGVISLPELKEMLSNDMGVEEEIWNEIFGEVDSNRDGMIDPEEFEAAVLLKGISW